MNQILDSFKLLIDDVYPALGELELGAEKREGRRIAQEKVKQGILRRIEYIHGLEAAAETVAAGLISFAEKLGNGGFHEIYGDDFVETVCHLVFCQDLGQSLFPLYEGRREYPLQRVLILGERGTGKERLAELVGKTFCALSNQTEERYYPVNAAALPEGLLESTLFGHVKGSFSGAYKDQLGFIERAHGGGTIFLDELGEASSQAQVKLLRVLQSGEYDRVGEFGGARKARFHVVAATNRPESDLRQGRGLREDLFDRLATSTIRIPPVRTLFKDPRATRRVLDWLADSVARELGLVSGLEWYKNAKRIANLIADSIASRLGDYPWPGNLREITKLIHQVFRLGESRLDKLVSEMKDTFQEDPAILNERSLPTEKLEIRLEAYEKRQYADAASKANTIGEVADPLGVTRQTVARALKRYNLRLGKLAKEAM